MVDVGAARGGVVEDTTFVGLEVVGVGVNGDGDGALSDGSLELAGAVGTDGGVVGDSGVSVQGGGVLAGLSGGAVAGDVRVVLLGLGIVGLVVGHGATR